MFYNKTNIEITKSIISENDLNFIFAYVCLCVCVPVFFMIPGLVSSITLSACSIPVVSYLYIFNESRQQCESRSDGSTALSIIINSGSTGQD